MSPYLDIPSSWSVFLIDSLGPGLSAPVQLSVLDLDISSPRLKTDYLDDEPASLSPSSLAHPVFGVGKGPNPRLGRQQVGRGSRSHHDLVHRN